MTLIIFNIDYYSIPLVLPKRFFKYSNADFLQNNPIPVSLINF